MRSGVCVTMPCVRHPWWRHLLRTNIARALIGLGWVSLMVTVTSPPRAYADSPLPTPTATLALNSTVTSAPALPAYPYQPAAFAQRDYFVNIEADGSVQVTEHWQLTFSGDPVSERDGLVALDLSLGPNQPATIAMVQVLGADPGSASLHSGPGAASFFATTGWRFNSRQSPAASAPPSNSTTFEVTYVIQDALGANASQAWFDWQFLDGGSNETNIPVAESTVSITFPQRTPAQEIQATATDPDHTPTVSYVHGDTIVATATGLQATHPFEVEVVFPRDEVAPKVDSETDSPVWQPGNSPPQLPSAPGHPHESVQFGHLYYADDGIHDPAPFPGPLEPLIEVGLAALLAVLALAIIGWRAYPTVMSTLRRSALVRKGGRHPRSQRKSSGS